MSEQPAPPPAGGIPKGLVWAAVLLGIAAVIGAVALLIGVVLWFSATPRGAATAVTLGQAPVPLPPGTEPAAPDSPAAPGAGIPSAPAALPPAPPAGAPTTVTAAGTQVVEDWSAYADDAALEAAFDVNRGWTDNQVTLALLPGAASPHGPAGVAVGYAIQAPAPKDGETASDYVGFERDLRPPQDWRGFDRLSAWVQTTDRSDRQLVLQFHEISGEVWRHRLSLKDVPMDGRVTVPLRPDQWEWADWSTRENGQLDLDQIIHFGIFIGHNGPGAGEVRLGTIAVERPS